MKADYCIVSVSPVGLSERIRQMTKRHARAVAGLHLTGIQSGFLTSLGPRFLRQLYAAIPSCPAGFGRVWQEPDGQVLGFIACTESTGRLYKQSFLRRGLLMALPLLRYMFRFSMLKRMWETLRYPSETTDDLPAAEVLSIVVSDETRGKGVGKALMKAAMEEFVSRGIKQVRVAVGADNEVANKFYLRCGFELAMTREHHGLNMNIYTSQTGAD